MELSNYPGVTKVIVSTRLKLPDPNVHRVLVVETDIPLTEKHEGYDPDQFAMFVEVVRAAMDEVEAEKAEIHPAVGCGPILHGHRTEEA
jgi:hypothetical protein